MNLAAIGKRVKLRRLELGLDQTQVAEQIGRTRGYVSRLEAGKSGENITDLIAIARALGWKLADLIGETNEAMVAEIRKRLPDGTELAVSFERIAKGLPNQTEAEQQFIRQTIEALAERFGAAAPTDGE